MADVELIGVLVGSGTKTKVTGGKTAIIDSILKSMGGNLQLQTSGTRVEVQAGKSIVSLGGGNLVGFTIDNIPVADFLTEDDNLVIEFLETPTVPGGPPDLGSGKGKIWLRSDSKLIFTNDSQVDIVIGTVGGGGVAAFVQEALTPGFDGQTVFFTSTPVLGGGAHVTLTINGQEFRESVDFTLIATTLVWLDIPFTLETTDRLIVNYQIS